MSNYARRWVRVWGFTLTALTIFCSPLRAADQVPLRGTFGTTFTLTPLICSDPADPATCVVFDAPVHGTGRVSHLGNSTVTIEQTIDFTTNPALLVGTIAITAANGDQLFGTSSATASPPDAQGIATLAGTYVFTNGTGRFAGVHGSATFTGVANTIGLTGFFELSGKITSVGSAR